MTRKQKISSFIALFALLGVTGCDTARVDGMADYDVVLGYKCLKDDPSRKIETFSPAHALSNLKPEESYIWFIQKKENGDSSTYNEVQCVPRDNTPIEKPYQP